MSAKQRVGIVSLGCPRNLVDSESILGRLRDKGHEIVELDQADIAIVNTCAFIEDAKKESIDTILELAALKKEGKLKKLIVCGCLAQRYKSKLVDDLPEVDAFWGRSELSRGTNDYAITPGHYAYLKICESCVHRCSFCVIPKIKGTFTSLTRKEVLAKVKAFDAKGIAELNIIGQDITGYGVDGTGKKTLPALVRDILKNSPHIHWVRLLYLYPGPIVKEILDIMRDEPRLCRYIDLPIQHINDRILKLMRRTTTRQQIENLISLIRKKLPQAAIRTSVIVGFPTESEKEFLELLAFIKDVKFDRLGAFIYSREEGTAAYSLLPQVTRKVKVARFNKVMGAQQVISAEWNKRFLGKMIPVLIDERQENGSYYGRSEFDAPEVDGGVFVTSAKALTPGDFVRVKVTGTLEYDLVGEMTP